MSVKFKIVVLNLKLLIYSVNLISVALVTNEKSHSQSNRSAIYRVLIKLTGVLIKLTDALIRPKGVLMEALVTG